MTFTFTTESGSVYEVDGGRQRIRRVAGVEAPTVRQGDDGQWRPYAAISKVELGKPVIVGWATECAGDGDAVVMKVKATMTSPVSSCDAG